ncbi:hypothetical protein ACFY3B_03195 [Micromonospora parva]|uniref:Uncharacterized protein n=1 Tax=Micromonospora parva TaxID=1464048 RepID=A0ABW6VN00_9ACTN
MAAYGMSGTSCALYHQSGSTGSEQTVVGQIPPEETGSISTPTAPAARARASCAAPIRQMQPTGLSASMLSSTSLPRASTRS